MGNRTITVEEIVDHLKRINGVYNAAHVRTNQYEHAGKKFAIYHIDVTIEVGDTPPTLGINVFDGIKPVDRMG